MGFQQQVTIPTFSGTWTRAIGWWVGSGPSTPGPAPCPGGRRAGRLPSPSQLTTKSPETSMTKSCDDSNPIGASLRTRIAALRRRTTIAAAMSAVSRSSIYHRPCRAPRRRCRVVAARPVPIPVRQWAAVLDTSCELKAATETFPTATLLCRTARARAPPHVIAIEGVAAAAVATSPERR